MDVSKLEPADRDPKKLRATAYKIVLFMILSGSAILYAYVKFNKRTANSERPSLESKVTDTEVELLTSDGEMRNFQDLKGKVTIALTLSSEIQPESQPSLDALREVMAAFEDAPEKPTIVAFVLDGTNTAPEKISSVLSEFGEEPEVWRVVANDSSKSSIRSFSKTRLRFNQMPVDKGEGKFEYDTRLVLIDQHLHTRGLPDSNDGWDFGTVVKMEEAYRKAEEEHPDEELKPLPMTTPKLRETMIKSIQYLYNNPDEKAQR